MYRRLGARAEGDIIAAQITAIEETSGETKKHEEPR
jgi:hypothetical protein